MSMRKFTAPTAREALREIRKQLGENAVILSNRRIENGVEIVALAEREMAKMTSRFESSKENSKSLVVEMPQAKIEQAAHYSNAAQLAANQDILSEIKAMHSMLQQQLSAMSWSDAQQRNPQSASLLRRMLSAGFSTLLTRQLMDKMPASKAQSEVWVKKVLKRNLRVASADEDIVVKGGVYALIGPTGVGKTTTTAKLAARAVVRYGADKVALLTTDSYRIGAYEQLKIYGKILGVTVHAVKDTDDLRLTLAALRNKHLVLIDTVGMGQRDERVANQNEMFDATDVKRLLLLNSTSSGDTLEDVARMYRSKQIIGCIATKLDEAVNLGAVLDIAMRHKLVMHYMANGQRVPEDLHPIKLDYLLHRAIKPEQRDTPFTLQEREFPTVMASAAPVAKPVAKTAGGIYA